MKTDFEYIVVGCGGIGSAAVYWLSRRAGKEVLGLEQFKLGHVDGGSQDHSRIIRMVYIDDMYTHLGQDMYDAWEEVERDSGVQLKFETGGLLWTPKTMETLLKRYSDAMDRYNLPYQMLHGREISDKFHQFHPAEGDVGLYDPRAGLVDAAMSNAVHIQLAQGNGATVIDECPVNWVQRETDGYIRVYTQKGTFRCRRLVIASGAWTNEVLQGTGLKLPLSVTQEQVAYFATPHLRDFTKAKFPVWMYKSDAGFHFYGMPLHGNSGTKIATDAAGPVVTARDRSFTPDPVREEACKNFFARYIPKALGPLLASKTCLYTMPPDRHFIVDTLESRGFPEIVLCVGAGHAFKFASLLGRILSEIAVDGRTKRDISGFRVNRACLLNPETTNVDFHFGIGGGRGEPVGAKL